MERRRGCQDAERIGASARPVGDGMQGFTADDIAAFKVATQCPAAGGGMQYFTKELWRRTQSDQAEGIRTEWIRAHDDYRAQLERVRGRLDVDAFQFFSDADLHDGELLELSIVDGSRPAPLNAPVRPWQWPTGYPVTAAIKAIDAYDRFIWTLSYKNLRRILVDYPSDTPIFRKEGEGFGDWGYQELTDAGGGFLRHEILFASGATLLFEFKSVDVCRTARPYPTDTPSER